MERVISGGEKIMHGGRPHCEDPIKRGLRTNGKGRAEGASLKGSKVESNTKSQAGSCNSITRSM